MKQIFHKELDVDIKTFVPPLNVIDPSSLDQINQYGYAIVSLANVSDTKPCIKVYDDSDGGGNTGNRCDNSNNKMYQCNDPSCLSPKHFNFFGAHANSANSYLS